ncbi:OmpA family protein [Aliidiomarina sanyensis]|uniref:OprF n=1 Tax=Aliidiomarina sanyensis TaxID=1249555 RepID=A0A432WPT5_9GAMM|nr:OmpA family protein [Aliidiomarina sanyensis]RUO35794.1 OprF [Aliidiomarina sanyensis]
MKKLVGITIPALAGLLLVAPQAAAENYSGTHDIAVGVRVSTIKFDSDRLHVNNGAPFNLDSSFNTPQPGLEFSVPLTDRFSIRSYIDYVEASVDGVDSTSYGRLFGTDVLFHLNRNFFLGLGVNQTKVQFHRDRMYRGTVGYARDINDRWFWRAEYALQTSSDFDDQQFIGSVNYRIGSGGPLLTNWRSRDVAPVVEDDPIDRTTDSDGDGVPDYRDECPNTPRGHVVDERGCTVYTTEQVSQDLRVGFAFDSARVTSDYRGDIRRLADFMREHSDTQVTLHGHTDLIGTREYNQGLSERRARAVADILVNEHGIDRSRIRTVGHGMSQPVVNEISLPANARNRRTEARLTVEIRVPQTR